MRHRRAQNIVEALQLHAATTPDKVAFRFLDHRGFERESISFSTLDQRAQAVATLLENFRSQQAAILLPSGIDFVVGILGSFYAGVTAVPMPTPSSLGEGSARLKNIINDSDTTIAITNSQSLETIQSWLEREKLIDITYINIDKASQQLISRSCIQENDIAFIQYTSGSTGEPKGVIVHHAGIMANAKETTFGFAMDDTDIVVSWLPMFHDMGLVGKVFQPIITGATCVLLAPATFLKRPYLWFEAISRYRGTISGGPNFAFDQCVKRITNEQASAYDLSSWRVAFCGSEPVRASTVRAFTERFARNGFRETGFCPVYGLAEGTLHLTTAQLSKSPNILEIESEIFDSTGNVQVRVTTDAPTREIVSVGRSYCSNIEVVDPQTKNTLLERHVGEIWVRGSSCALGYWNSPSSTAETFHNTLGMDSDWLRTGDLGFVHDGELYITGRLKELIIVRGRNLYPHDIELTVQNVDPMLLNGAGAAFGLELEQEEELVIVQEVARRQPEWLWEDLANRIRNDVLSEFGVAVAWLIFVRQSSIRRTTSGKIKRSEMRKRLLSGTLDTVYESLYGAKPVSFETP